MRRPYVVVVTAVSDRRWATAPLSSKPSKFSFAVSLVPTLKRYPVGALFGLVLTGVVSLVLQVFPSRVWLEIPITLICVAGCMVIERLLDWRFSGIVDARMRHASAAEDARLGLEKLEDYQRRGFISKPDAHKVGGKLARRDVAGGPRQVRARGPYKKHASHELPPNGSGLADDAAAERSPRDDSRAR